MMHFPQRQTCFFPPSAFLYLLIAFFPVSCQGASFKNPAEAGTADFVKLSSRSYTAQHLKAFEAQQKNLLRENGENADTLIRLAQACWILGEFAEAGQKLDYYNKGRYYAERLIRENPSCGDGYYWKAVNLCGVAETGGAGRALRLLPEIVENMEKAAEINPAIDQGGPHRVLGRIFCEAPAWPMSVGDIEESLRHLTLAVQIAPDNSTNHLYLAETLLRLEQEKQALAELDKVFQSTQHATWPLGVEEDRQEARRMQAKIKNP